MICTPISYSTPHNATRLFIWKDLTSSYLQRSFSQLVKNYLPDTTFIEHNFSLTGLLYNIRAGKGCSLLTRKMATMYKVDGVEYIAVKDKRPTIYMYHASEKKISKIVFQIKSIINDFI